MPGLVLVRRSERAAAGRIGFYEIVSRLLQKANCGCIVLAWATQGPEVAHAAAHRRPHLAHSRLRAGHPADHATRGRGHAPARRPSPPNPQARRDARCEPHHHVPRLPGLWARGYLDGRPGSYSTVRRPGQLRALPPERGEAAVDWSALVAPPSAGLRAAFEALPGQAGSARGRDRLRKPRLRPGPHRRGAAARRRSTCWCTRARTCSATATRGNAGPAGGDRPAPPRPRHHGDGGGGPGDRRLPAGARRGARGLSGPATRWPWAPPTRWPTRSSASTVCGWSGSDTGRWGRHQAVQGCLEAERPARVHVPNFQNPTGITTSQAHRERLLRLCREHHDAAGGGRLRRRAQVLQQAVLPIKSMDRDGLVIYLGTFSKVVFSGLRVGWVHGPGRPDRSPAGHYRFSNLSGNTLSQAALARFIATGGYGPTCGGCIRRVSVPHAGDAPRPRRPPPRRRRVDAAGRRHYTMWVQPRPAPARRPSWWSSPPWPEPQ